MLSFWSSRWAVPLLATAVLVGTASGQATFTFINGDTNATNSVNEIDDIDLTNVLLDYGATPANQNGITDLDGDGDVGETWGKGPAGKAPSVNPGRGAPVQGSPYTPGRPIFNP